MKRIFSVFLCLAVWLSAFGYDFKVDGIAYNTIGNGLVEVASGGSYSGSVVIPSSVTYAETHTYSVTSIGDEAFSDCSSLTSIDIPNSVTSIGDDVFAGCISLTSISVDANNTHYDSRNNCNAIIETSTNTLISGCMSTIIPNSVNTIGYGAFLGCFGLTSVTIPNSVNTIGYAAFAYCISLTSIDIPNSVTAIGDAFWGCNSLTSVTIPKCAMPLSNYFSDCPITSVTIAEGVDSIPYSAFSYHSRLTSVTIPNSVTSIGFSAFYGCSGLTSVTIPNSVTSIGSSAFSGCSGLTSVTIPNSVTSIGYYAFSGCDNLTTVTIPQCAMPLSNYFSGCPITSVTIAEGVDSIPASAFYNYTDLISVTMPNSLTFIGSFAFYGCSGLTSLTIPSNVISIGNMTFASCNGLTSISVDANNTHYDSRNDCNAIIETATNKLVAGCAATIIPDSVTSIGDYAFYGFSDLTSVTIPSSVTSIGSNAFAGCANIADITCHATTPPTIQSNTFANYDATLYVPASSEDDYSSARYWRNFYIQPLSGATYTIIVNSNNDQMGTTIGGENYEDNTNARLIAVPHIGYIFQRWSDGNTDNPRNVVVTKDSTFTAYFADPASVHDTIIRIDTLIVRDTVYEVRYDTVVRIDTLYEIIRDTVYEVRYDTVVRIDTLYEIIRDTVYEVVYDTVYITQTDTIYLEYDGRDAMQYTLEDYGVYYLGGKVYNSQNLYIKLYYSDGKLISTGTNDIEMSSYPNGIYIVTDGKGGFMKINHYR